MTLTENDVTCEELYKQRRKFLKTLTGIGLSGLGLSTASCSLSEGASLKDELTKYRSITHYNNFYEFGVEKEDPAEYAHTLKTNPWSVVVEGECEKSGEYSLEDILKPMDIEERIYRFRCVEGWSMVIPWNGFTLGALLKRFQPTSKAKFVYFETLYDPEMMPGQDSDVLDWPYVEALRIDEAMNDLTLLSTGIYGKSLLNQNGAPLRLVVPWKYGFKSIKSIVRIRFTEHQPINTWQKMAPAEYSFYSNVNPHVAHPRWSQKKERRIGEFKKRETLMFNGYAEQVASMYKGMDLKINF